MTMRTLTVLPLALAAMLSAWPAHADNRQACITAYDQAQTLRRQMKLTEARDQLKTCARSSCPASIVKDCTTWLDEIEQRIPSVVLVPTDAKGAALPNVAVSMDGASDTRNVDGRSWEMDPGVHTFTFITAAGTRVDKSVLVVEGQKAQRVAAILGAAELASVTPPGTAIVASPPEGTSGAPAADSGKSKGFPFRPVGYAVGAVGLAGIAVGSIFGAEALSTKSSHCPTETTCSRGSASTVTSDATISTVGFIAGGVLAAVGLTLVLVAPGKEQAHAARVEAGPLVGGGSGGLMVSGRWW